MYVINKLLIGYNSVHSTIGMPTSKVSPSNIYSVWKGMNSLWVKIPQGRLKYKVGDLLRITNGKVKFAKGYEKTFSTEIFRVVKVIQRVPQRVYELSDLQDLPIKGQFYSYELVKVTVLPQTQFEIDKIVRTRKNGGIKQHIFKWRGSDETFHCWVNAYYIKKIYCIFLHCRQTVLGTIFQPTK